MDSLWRGTEMVSFQRNVDDEVEVVNGVLGRWTCGRIVGLTSTLIDHEDLSLLSFPFCRSTEILRINLDYYIHFVL